MDSQKVWLGGGQVGFLGMLTVLFIGLKLTGHIAWSWWWVLSPLWIPPALFGGFVAICAAVAFIVARIRGGR